MLYNRIGEKFNLPFLHWSLKLFQIADLKSKILKDSDITSDEKYCLAIKEMPRFIWVLSCSISKDEKIDFLFDATDIDQGVHFFSKIIYNRVLNDYFYSLFKVIDLNLIKNPNTNAMLNDILENKSKGDKSI